ncbi:alpha/beta hydrolase [Streptomyces sp. NPDC052101]|uniref:alpha/beta fold hydrolase n=1 Tax=Streptomyces sp. NPDC052101 TaxID=3155763 RepID=UPI0034146E7E
MGASIAVDTALEHPELVRAVVVSGAGTSEPYFTDPWTTKTWAAWQSAMAAGDLDASVEAFTLFAAGPHRTLGDLNPKVVRHLCEMTRGTLSKHTADEPNFLTLVRDTWNRAVKIDVPVLAINGAIDSPDHIGMAERLTRTVTDGRAISIDGTAHFPNMERPDAFNETLDRGLPPYGVSMRPPPLPTNTGRHQWRPDSSPPATVGQLMVGPSWLGVSADDDQRAVVRTATNSPRLTAQ